MNDFNSKVLSWLVQVHRLRDVFLQFPFVGSYILNGGDIYMHTSDTRVTARLHACKCAVIRVSDVCM